MDAGKLVNRLITIALTLGSLGLLYEATLALKQEALGTHRHAVSLGAFNRRLERGR